MTDTDTTARYLIVTLQNHLRANDILPDWEHTQAIAKAIEAAAGPYLDLSIPHGATALAVARDLLSDDSIAYLIDSATATARDLVTEWAVSLTECPDDEVWCIDGERVAYAVGKGFCWQLSEGDGPTVLNIRRREEASDIASTMDAIRSDDEDLRGALCGMCHTARPYRDIDGDGCLEPGASPYCPTCGAEYEEGAGYRERVDAICPHCQGSAEWVPARGDAPGHDVCTLCAAVCDLDPTHGPTWGPPASEYLCAWTVRPHEYLR